MCTTNAQERLLVRVVWCEDCLKWHFKLSLQQRSAPSSRQWSNIDEAEVDVSPQEREWGWSPPVSWPDLSNLQRLYVEREAGVTRLF